MFGPKDGGQAGRLRSRRGGARKWPRATKGHEGNRGNDIRLGMCRIGAAGTVGQPPAIFVDSADANDFGAVGGEGHAALRCSNLEIGGQGDQMETPRPFSNAPNANGIIAGVFGDRATRLRSSARLPLTKSSYR